MLDCGSYCNFISNDLVSKLNIKPKNTKTSIKIRGISGITTTIKKFISLNFQLKLLINKKFHYIDFKEKFLITNAIPTDLLFGNLFMSKYKIHYSYDNNYLYSTLKFNEIKRKFNFNDSYYINSNSNSYLNNKINNKNNNYQYFRKNNYISTTINKIKNDINSKNNKIIFNKKISKNKNKFNNKKFIYSFLLKNEDDYDDFDDDEDSEEPKIEDIPEPYRDLYIVFSKKKADTLPPHRLTDCKIVLEKDATLHYSPIYSLGETESKVLEDYIKENLKKKFIRPSESPAGYPVVFQKKKDGSLRVCIDYRKLNAVTIRNSYPLPLITDIIERIRGAKYFTKLDLRSAYNLIRIREGDEYKTAFRTKFGHYEYLVMPFGLKNAPATFQSFINSVLRPYLEKFVILYLDDILVYSENLEDHHKHVRMVLQKLIDNNLYAKLQKCEFDKSKVEFLGYILSGDGVETDPKKIKSVTEWPTPTCVKDVQRFVGLCNYYRRFVKNFALIAKPLHNLTKKNIKFKWDNDCEQAFQKLKQCLSCSPILMHPNPQKPYILECDASNYAIGSILSQYDEDHKLHPVAYFSRSLSNTEINYSITEKELLAIKDSFSTWRHLLLGARHKITVYTDHRNLLYTLGGKIGNQRQHRWHLFFQEYDFNLIYRQGRKNGKPDSLSRRPDYQEKQLSDEENPPEYILDIKNVKEVPCFIGIMSDLLDKIVELTKDDETAKDIHWYFSPQNANHDYNFKPFKKMNKFQIKNDLILYNNLIYIPKKLRPDILEKYHDQPSAGHLGIKRTLEIISRNFWWPKMKEDVINYVKSCESCARNKFNRHRKYGLLQPLDTPDRPWMSIEIDFLCGLPESKGFTTIMVVVDRFSKMIHLIPFKDIPDATETAKAFIKEIFRLHGLPKDIYTDRGTQFTSALWQELMEKLRIKSKIATTDHHETVGQVERCNSFIEQYLRAYSKAYFHDDWVDWIHLAEFAYNNSVNESTKETPFFINYGFHPPMDEIYLFENVSTNRKILKDLSENFNHIKNVLLRSKELYKNSADKRRMPPPTFKIDDEVWIQAPPSLNTKERTKLAPCKYGPYKILEVLDNNNYKIDIRRSPFPKHHNIFHVSELEPYYPPTDDVRNRRKTKESYRDIVEINGFRPNYKKNCYEYRICYKYSDKNHWVPSEEVENNPRNKQIYLLYLKNNRKPTSISYN